MKSRFSLLIFVLCFMVLLPNVASAMEFEDSNITFSANDEGRAVTPEEFKLISDTLVTQQQNNPSITVEEVIEQLGLKNVEVYYEHDFEVESLEDAKEFGIMSPQSINVGLENPIRSKTAFSVQPTLINYEYTNFNYIGKVEGFNKPANNVGGGYVKTITNRYFQEYDVGRGVTKVFDRLYMAHYDVDAIFTIEAIILDGEGPGIPRYYEVKSNTNGTFRTNIYKPTVPYDQQ